MSARAVQQASDPLDGRWILVVDDEPAVRVAMARLLSTYGAVCCAAESHERALRLLESEPRLEVAILDFTMPDGNGSDLVPQLRAVRPELVMVGTSGADRREEFRRSGVDRFLPKPWSVEELIEQLGH